MSIVFLIVGRADGAKAVTQIRGEAERGGIIRSAIWPVRQIRCPVKIEVGAQATWNGWARERRGIIGVAIAICTGGEVTGLDREAEH